MDVYRQSTTPAHTRPAWNRPARQSALRRARCSSANECRQKSGYRGSWHRVISAAAPRMTAANSFYSQPQALERTVLSQGFEGIGAACGCEAACRRRERRYACAIKYYGHAQEPHQSLTEHIHRRRPVWRNECREHRAGDAPSAPRCCSTQAYRPHKRKPHLCVRLPGEDSSRG